MASALSDKIDPAQFQEMWDVLQIERVLNKYCRAFDQCDVEAAKDTYWPDALDDHGGFVGNGQDMCSYWDDQHKILFDSTQHYITNNEIEIDGDTAHSESYVIMAARMKDSFDTVMVGARYLRRLERREGVWKIAATVCTVHWASDPATAESVVSASAEAPRDKTDWVYHRPLEVTRPVSSNEVSFR